MGKLANTDTSEILLVNVDIQSQYHTQTQVAVNVGYAELQCTGGDKNNSLNQ